MRALMILALVATSTLATSNFEIDSVIGKLKEKVGNSLYGAQISELLELDLTSGAPIDDIISLIGGILNNLESDQNADDLEHSKRMAQFETTISNLEGNVESLNSENQDNNRNIGDLTQEIASLAGSVGALERQLTLLNSREESIRQTRQQESASFEKRGQNNEKILTAITQIRSKLTQALLGKNNAVLLQTEERAELINQVKKELGDRHPITVLVQMTSKFDEPTVKRIIEKLEAISNAIQSSQADDERNDQNAESTTQAILAEIGGVRDKLSVDYQSSSTLQTTKGNNLVMAQRRKDEIVEDQETTTTLLVTTRNQSQQYDSSYSSRRTSRLAELDTIKQAHDLLTAHAEKLKSK